MIYLYAIQLRELPLRPLIRIVHLPLRKGISLNTHIRSWIFSRARVADGTGKGNNERRENSTHFRCMGMRTAM